MVGDLTITKRKRDGMGGGGSAVYSAILSNVIMEMEAVPAAVWTQPDIHTETHRDSAGLPEHYVQDSTVDAEKRTIALCEKSPVNGIA